MTIVSELMEATATVIVVNVYLRSGIPSTPLGSIVRLRSCEYSNYLLFSLKA